MTHLKFKHQFPNHSNLMENFFGSELLEKVVAKAENYYPKTNIYEVENGYNLELSVPGYKKEQFKIEVEKNNLVVSVVLLENKDEVKPSYTLKQFTLQNFTKKFTLPENANTDKIEATYLDGILSILIAKSVQTPSELKSITIK